MAPGRSDKLVINVGGTRFLTTSTTIANAGRESMLCSLLDENWQIRRSKSKSKSAARSKHRAPDSDEDEEEGAQRKKSAARSRSKHSAAPDSDEDEEGEESESESEEEEEEEEEAVPEFFIDRNPEYFSVLLDLLRTGELRIPQQMNPRALIREAIFYGVEAHVKSASWEAPLDGNRVECRASIRVGGATADDPVAIRASPHGGCGVGYGCMVHLYDWSLERLRPVSLDFMNVNDFGFLAKNPARVVVCAMDRGEIGGLGCFNAATGKLEQRFRLNSTADSSSKGANFLALACASSDCEVFASCRMRGAKGIGIWDQETAQNLVFFSSSFLGEGGSKLQWLPGSNLLLVASMFPQSDHCFLTLLDLRQKCKAWEWTDCEKRNEPVIMDAVAIESRNMICVVDQYDNLGFIDTRLSAAPNPAQQSRHAAVNWSHTFQRLKRSELEEHSYSKLRINNPSSENMQLFSSKEDAVLVHSCSASSVSASTACYSLATTAKLVSGIRGAIADLDVGGDRLFVLHGDENVFDVWETPT